MANPTTKDGSKKPKERFPLRPGAERFRRGKPLTEAELKKEADIRHEKKRSALLLASAAKLKQRIIAARKHPADFIEFVMRTPKGEKIELQWFHREWLELMLTHRRVQIQAAKSHGKCLAPTQRIHLADGRALTAAHLSRYKQISVLTYNPDSDHYGSGLAYVFDNGINPLIRLEMQSGRVIERTPEEPMLTQKGFIPISQVRPGDKLASARWLPEPITTEPVTDTEASTLAKLTAKDKAVRLNDFILQAGCVPEIIWRADNQALERYLQAFFISLPHIVISSTYIAIPAKHRRILEDIQTLVLRFGFPGCITEAPENSEGYKYLFVVYNERASAFRELLLKPSCKWTFSQEIFVDPLVQEPPDLNFPANIWFDQVKFATRLSDQQTYGITIPSNPVYVAENTIAHNTTILLGFTIWAIGSNPDIRIKFFAQSETKIKERLNVITTMIETNKLVKLVFPHLLPDPKGPWTNVAIQVQRNITDKDATISASGIMGSVEGGRADLVLLDDISDHRNALLFPQHREAIKRKVYAEILAMLEEDGRAISIATPHHRSDVVASLEANPEWENRRYPVGTTEDAFVPLWPDRWPREALEKLRREIGNIEYDRAYRLKAVSLSSQIVKPEYIQYYTTDMLGDPWRLMCVKAYDLAISQAKGSSYFASVTLLYDPDNSNIYIADAWRDKLGFTEQAKAIIAEANAWQPQMIVVEVTGYQGALKEYLLELADRPLPVIPVSPGSKSKEARLMETTPVFEAGRIYFNPRLDPRANPDVTERGDIITCLLEFNVTQDKDLGDAFAYGVQVLRSYKLQDDEDDWSSGDGLSSRVSIL